MPLAGTFHRVLDEKRRVAIPKPLREEMGRPTPGKLFISQGSYKTLWILTKEQFDSWGSQLHVENRSDPNWPAFWRMFCARAELSDLDKQGRILIPDRLAEHASLGTETLLIGVFDHIQLWDPKRWAEFEQAHEGNYDATAERMFITKL